MYVRGMSSPLLALANGTAHAYLDGEVLCGVAADVTTRPYPDGERTVCRECSRTAAAQGSTVPLSRGRARRPGGM